MKLTIVAGARPNFLKIAPLVNEIERVKKEGVNISYRLVHTGQHYDDNLSRIFFDELEIPLPHANLEAGSGSQAVQTANIMTTFEQELLNNPCDMVIVVGDVNSTLACSIVAKKLNIEVAHIEAGIRSFDMTMPEEVNRIVTDSIADYYFTPTETANENLMRSGAAASQVYYVGNIMIDSLYKFRDKLVKPPLLEDYNLDPSRCIILTLHRPHNADDPRKLHEILKTLAFCCKDHQVVFPVHPRTKKTLHQTGFSHPRLIITEPQGYLSFIYLVSKCRAVVTDSGGIQEETTVMGVPCVTLRKNTERPETVTIGTNELIGDNMELLDAAINKIFAGHWKPGGIPDLWDGKAAQRIVKALLEIDSRNNKAAAH